MQICNLYSIHVEANRLMAPLYFYFHNHSFLHPRYFKLNIRYRTLDPRFVHTNLRTFRIWEMAANSNSNAIRNQILENFSFPTISQNWLTLSEFQQWQIDTGNKRIFLFWELSSFSLLNNFLSFKITDSKSHQTHITITFSSYSRCPGCADVATSSTCSRSASTRTRATRGSRSPWRSRMIGGCF